MEELAKQYKHQGLGVNYIGAPSGSQMFAAANLAGAIRNN